MYISGRTNVQRRTFRAFSLNKTPGYQGKLNGQMINRFQREYVQGRAEHFPRNDSSLQKDIWAKERTVRSKRHRVGEAGRGVGKKENELCICHEWRNWRVRSPAGEKDGTPTLGKNLPDPTVEKTRTSREWEMAKFVHEGRGKYRNYAPCNNPMQWSSQDSLLVSGWRPNTSLNH